MSSTKPAPSAPVQEGARIRWRPRQTVAVSVAYVIGMTMSGMDMHIVNVALPTLGRDFHAPLSSVQWTVIAYLLTLAVVIPASGWVGDRVGTKRTFVFALATFTVASALCGLAQSLGELIAARALQGVGGGMLTPMGTAMLYRAFGPERRAVVTRTLIVPVLIGPGLAPVVGGLFTEDLSWRWVFLVNVPIGVASIAYAQLFIAEHRASAGGGLDVVGLVLSGLGLSLVMYAVSQGSAVGWGSAQIVGTAVAGVVLLAAFARLSRRRPDPLLRLGLLRDRLFRATNVTYGLALGSFLGTLYLTPIFLQQVLHQSAISSGLTTFVETIGVAFAAQTTGRLYPRIGPRVLAGCSALALAAVLAAFLLVGPGTGLWWVRALMVLAGVANGGNVLAVQSAMFTHVSRADTAHASAIFNTNRQASIAICVAVLTTVVAGVTGAGGAPLSAFHAAYGADAGIALLGAIAAWALIRTDDARTTMLDRR